MTMATVKAIEGEIVDDKPKAQVLTVPVADIRMMAEAVAKSKLFGMKTADEAMALMLIAHAEGLHPAIAARDYHIIQGKPAKSSEAMLRSFLSLGGKVEWHALTDEKAEATFSHPQGGSVRIGWDIARAKKAGLLDKNGSMFLKYPRPMLRARVVSEGVRTVHPGATSGMYTPEEVRDFDEPRGKPQAIEPETENVTPGVKAETISEAQQKQLWKQATARASETEGAVTKEQIVRDVLVFLKLEKTADIPAAELERVFKLIEQWDPELRVEETEGKEAF
jgi:hypothetical protein